MLQHYKVETTKIKEEQCPQPENYGLETTSPRKMIRPMVFYKKII